MCTENGAWAPPAMFPERGDEQTFQRYSRRFGLIIKVIDGCQEGDGEHDRVFCIESIRVSQGISKVTTAVFRSRESENSHQISGLYPNIRMAEDRFNAGILRISEMPSGPGVRTIETPIKIPITHQYFSP